MNAPTKKLVGLKNGICFSQLCEGLDCDAPSCPDRVTSFAEHCFGKWFIMKDGHTGMYPASSWFLLQ